MPVLKENTKCEMIVSANVACVACKNTLKQATFPSVQWTGQNLKSVLHIVMCSVLFGQRRCNLLFVHSSMSGGWLHFIC